MRRFLSLEKSLKSKNEFQDFEAVMREYVDLKHAELVPPDDLDKPKHQVFYLPMHVVYKESTTTKEFSTRQRNGVSL